jgi:hypothetical protein
MKRLIILFLLLSTASAFPQGDAAANAQTAQSELQLICHKLYHEKRSDEEKAELNAQMLKKLGSLLNEPHSFENYSFDSLKSDIGVLISPDEQFRIIHWNIPKADGTHEYYGFIQEKYSRTIKKGFKKTRIDSVQVYPLVDRSSEIKNPDNAITDNRKWYGALYNRIIEKKTKNKTYYTLIGWDGNDKFSQKKLIDVLTFDQNGVPHFGADIFNFGKKYPKRVIFEYSATCTGMPVRYNAKKDTIIFGHLAPMQPQLEGQFQYYCCDMSYDGFGWKKGKWNYGADVRALNDREESDKHYHDPHDRSEGHNQSNEYKDPNHKKRSRKKTQ